MEDFSALPRRDRNLARRATPGPCEGAAAVRDVRRRRVRPSRGTPAAHGRSPLPRTLPG
ncbi:hypothetical protein AB0L59_22875 [Streptomyces sp. NPDC052109]|uniref:hypothetical protein n=1 Tax=Streptomyces sp. NPDC052109 TaxID=3155527 RepID=UPI00342F09B1